MNHWHDFSLLCAGDHATLSEHVELNFALLADDAEPLQPAPDGKGQVYNKDRHAEAPRPDPAIFRRHGVMQIDHCTIGIFLLDGR